MKIQVIHGPNLQLLGTREPTYYGNITLPEIDALLEKKAKSLKHDLLSFQSNHEGEIVDVIGKLSQNKFDFLIINPGALTHTSIAVRDAILASGIPAIEVHLSNIYAREPFRQKSYISDIVLGQISGLGHWGYLLAIEYASEYYSKKVDARSSK